MNSLSEQPEIIKISSSAQEKIKELFGAELANGKNPQGLRLGVIGGGCSGLQYQMQFGESQEKDNILEFLGFKVFLDPKSTIYLKGILLDYEDGLQGKGFVFKNPNASNTCGCGESFSI